MSIIPETPDCSARRTSRRRSAWRKDLNQTGASPEFSEGSSVFRKTIVEESPVQATQDEVPSRLDLRIHALGLSTPSTIKRLEESDSDDDVPPSHVTPISQKVESWLQGIPSPAPRPTPRSRSVRSRRKSTIDDFCRFVCTKENTPPDLEGWMDVSFDKSKKSSSRSCSRRRTTVLSVESPKKAQPMDVQFSQDSQASTAEIKQNITRLIDEMDTPDEEVVFSSGELEGPNPNAKVLSGGKDTPGTVQPIAEESSPDIGQPITNSTPHLAKQNDTPDTVGESSKGSSCFQNYSTDSAKALIAKFEEQFRETVRELTPNAEVQQLTPNTGAQPLTPNAEVQQQQNMAADARTSKQILDGVLAYVEVRSKNENRSQCVKEQLMLMGAQISEKLTPDVTHVIFKEGRLATYNKAKKSNIHIVSVLWIEECKKEQKKVLERLFPSTSKERYESPRLFSKLRKAKSMQPKTDEDLSKKFIEKMKRQAARRKKKNEESKTTPVRLPVPLDYYNSPSSTAKKAAPPRGTLLDIIEEIENSPVTPANRPSLCGTPNSASSEEFNTPLAKRIMSKYFTPGRMSLDEASLRFSDDDSLHKIVEAEEENISTSSDVGTKTRRSASPSALQTTKSLPVMSTMALKPPLVEEPTRKRPSPSPVRDVRRKSMRISAARSSKEHQLLRKVPSPKKVTRRPAKKKKLFSQTSLLADTPPATPEEMANPTPPPHVPLFSQEAAKAPPAASPSFTKPSTQALTSPPFAKPIKVRTAVKKRRKPAPQNRSLQTIRSPRRSSIEFAPIRQGQPRTARKSPPMSIACTSCKPEDVQLLEKLTKNFGRFVVRKEITANTSHVVSGDGRRTLNLLRGIMRGCWVVSGAWLYACLEAGAWVDEEPFELVDFSMAVRTCRVDRQSFGDQVYKSELFKDCGDIYVSRNTKVPPKDLLDLISLGGGHVSNLKRTAEIVVGEKLSEEWSNRDCVDEKWLLDSIQYNVVMPLIDYRLT